MECAKCKEGSGGNENGMVICIFLRFLINFKGGGFAIKPMLLIKVFGYFWVTIWYLLFIYS